MDQFEFNFAPVHVIFGNGTLEKLPEELKQLNASKPFIVSTAGKKDLLELAATALHGHATSIARFAKAVMHTPINVTNEALECLKSADSDSVISIGGGSTIGLGKALCFRTGLPHICIPTTYSGSEMTAILGETDGGAKKTVTDEKARPKTVIYDVDLTMTLPAGTSAVSGVNALAHAVEALYAKNRNPVIALIAQDGVKNLAEALPKIVQDPSDKSARQRALYGAWMCGVALGNMSMSLHHKLCHVLGGSFGLPHAETHTIVLPHALSYNAPEIPDQMAILARCLPNSEGDAVKGLNVLLDQLQVRRGLKELGMQEKDIDRAAEIAVSNPYWNPRPIAKEPLREVIRRCWAGEPANQDL